MLENTRTVNNAELIEMIVEACQMPWPFAGDNAYGMPGLVLGHQGGGKSSAFKQAADALSARSAHEWQFIDIRVLLYDPVELKGLQALPDDADCDWTRLLRPDWMRGLDPNGHYILGFEELTKAPQTVQNACYQIFLDREVAGHTFGPNWVPMGTGNLMSSRSGDNPIPAALRDRFWIVILENDAKGWIEWAQGAGIHPVVWSWVRQNPDVLNDWNPETDPLCFSTGRSLEMLSITQNAGADAKRWAIPLLGEERGREFKMHCDVLSKLPDPMQVLSSPDRAPVMESIGPAFYLANALAAFVTEDTMPALCTYARRCQHEVAQAMVNGAVRRKPELKETADYIRFTCDYDARQNG